MPSLDDTFSCDSALQRLLARFPALRSDPKLSSLSLKGAELTEDDVVGALAEPFLHPRYTIPIMGCFRPVNARIVEKAVALLRLLLKLSSPGRGHEEAAAGAQGGEAGEGDVRVVEFYVAKGDCLRLHELACLALCRALDLSPFLLPFILQYFNFSPPPFKRFLIVDFAIQLPEQEVDFLLTAIRISFRYVIMEPTVFSELWNWSCLLDIVQNTEASGLSSSSILDIRWCCAQILSVVLRMSDKATERYNIQDVDALACFLRWEQFCQDVAIEKAGWYVHAEESEPRDFSNVSIRSNVMEFIGTRHTLVAHSSFEETDTNHQSFKKITRCDSEEHTFVLTSALLKSYEMSLMAVSQKWPVLIYGPSGVGKTTLIDMLSVHFGSQVLFIHMDEQMDSKTLIGSFVCSEQPGQFKWQPGSLTQAVIKGLWVVFEDIDKAPSEIHSILLPLLEGSSSFTTSHGEEINVAGSFRLFSTVTSSKHDILNCREGSALWRKVMVKVPSSEDLVKIVNTRYPCLKPMSMKLIETFQKVNVSASNLLGGFQAESITELGRFSVRHLLKWCRRIFCLGCTISGISLSSSDCRNVYQEAVDVFASLYATMGSRLIIMREIASVWGIPMTEAENSHYHPSVPRVQRLQSSVRIGRVDLQSREKCNLHCNKQFINLRSSLYILEKIACSVKCNEPVLLVGETGTGKTTLVQNLALWLGQPLTVLNLSQQSDVADLVGGFKPADACSICIPLHKEFKELFRKTISQKDNEDLLHRYEMHATEKKWNKLLKALRKCVNNILAYLPEKKVFGACVKRKWRVAEDILERWKSFSSRLEAAYSQLNSSSGMTFSFVEGAFVNAMKNGHWILLDEVNLAPPETLQRIVGVLDGDNGTLCLAERGDFSHIDRHPCFRIFACMNPATDAGKRDLPLSFRSRFTEYFVDDVLDDDDLTVFVRQNMGESKDDELTHRIVSFYKAAKAEAEVSLQDSANQKPHFSLRSLARALEYMRHANKKFGYQKALYDGFGMFFLTLLDEPSRIVMNKMILSQLMKGNVPHNVPFDSYITRRSNFYDNSVATDFVRNYVLTRSVKEHLKNIARAIFIKRYPVLLQGPTSSGKTSLVQYLASVTGHEFVRINNHEHTDLQEYLGTYTTNSNGRLEFQEGALVKAVRRGCWIVLDELNLAPSDVLEALNRLLDDNRELYVPELQETISAHTDFMLFATQNPPTLYGGRKMLSRAFRNRFLEIHVDEIPEEELSTILEERCKIPKSYAQKMVDVSKDLQLHRQKSKVFAGKHGYITPRDLFKWANRYHLFGKSQEDLIRDGYLLLAERLREESEKDVLFEVFKKVFREKHLDIKDLINCLYSQGFAASHQKYAMINPRNVIWTKSMERLFFLVERCYQLREPVLLVGDTGGGKTTVCQVLSEALGLKLHILNCHQYTETSDFLGGYHPVRDRPRLAKEFRCHVQSLKASKIFLSFAENHEISPDIAQAASTLDCLNGIMNQFQQSCIPLSDFTSHEIKLFEQLKQELLHLHKKWLTLFLWQDGPLVQAMKDGDLFLLDEISLADDSVLERLNSVLEPERTLSLAEKGGSALEKISAHSNFFILATMNPGGDYGKKELSPALRNRFTEIWVPPVIDAEDLESIVLRRLKMSMFSCVVKPMLQFWEWFNQMEVGRTLTVRDLLSWVSFINRTGKHLGPSNAFMHGAFLVLLDGLSLGMGISEIDATKLRMTCFSFLLEHLKGIDDIFVDSELSTIDNFGWGNGSICIDPCLNNVSSQSFGIKPFYIKKGPFDCDPKGFEFMAQTTCRNTLRVLRAMQLAKPVLLEGSPGVGKTSLVVALAKYSGHSVVRINLSEQTDMMDLLGSDLPTHSADKIEFSWSDGILLQAIKAGSWVLLDELNLAPQSVLEGLNAILDHRAEVYIPELDKTIKCLKSFRIFACQNPSSQGGGRKGLPKSFLNRFTKVFIDELFADDYLFICSSLYPRIPIEMLRRLIDFNRRVYEDIVLFRRYGQNGAPWEFNLRDVIRSCQIIEDSPSETACQSFLNVIYCQRLRTASDRRSLFDCFEEVFGVKPDLDLSPRMHVNPCRIIVGSACVQRNHFQPSKVLRDQLVILPQIALNLEALLHCLRHQWLCILVGPSSSGKTSMIRWLAQTTGNSLNELNLSSGTDVSELLGCFEQYNALHTFQTIMKKVENYIYEYCSLQLLPCWKDLLDERRSLIDGWLAFLEARSSGSFSSSSALLLNYCEKSCKLLADVITQLKLDLEKYQLPVSWSSEDLKRSLKTVLDLQNSKTMQQMARFEWVSGGLIKAIECGEWIVLDNANLCNPTVLDRINSLVEPSGLITVNECGLVDGKPLVLRAHPNFRMFLTVDPKYGEVSRAMRNRAVEIFLMEPALMLEDDNGPTCGRSRLNDVKRFLVASGIPLCNLIDSMAEAHLYAKEAGSQLGVDITFLELTRWVQLFQRLLMTGNHPIWSMQLSWEHTYLSSLGENNGKDIIDHGKTLLSSTNGFCKSGASFGGSLYLPGGWPFPLRTRYSLWFSRETAIRKNCMLVEYLGAQCASFELSKAVGAISVLDIDDLRPAIIPVDLLGRLLFPVLSGHAMHMQSRLEHFDLELTSKMLLIAGKWTIEQATADNIELYLLLFEWCNTQFQPYCTFFKSFSDTLRLVKNHPFWNLVVDCWCKVSSAHDNADYVKQVPLFSFKWVKLTGHRGIDECQELLHIATNSVSLLFLSIWQWNTEIGYITKDRDLSPSLSLVFKSLRLLEEEVLDVIFKFHYTVEIVEMYVDLIDHHNAFWETTTLSLSDRAAVAWSLLKKKVIKFHPLVPEAVNRLLVDSSDLERFSVFNLYSSKPMLWLYGGHPLLPASSTVFYKLCQLSAFCHDIWPGLAKIKNYHHGDQNGLLDVAASTMKDLRKLVMEGVCMSSHISMNYDLENDDIIHQLGEIYENLLARLECERCELQGAVLASEKGLSSYCCRLHPELLCRKTGFAIWLDINLLVDRKSFYLDVEILEQLSKAAILPQDELYQVLGGLFIRLQCSIEYSLQFSSRCPTEFAPHQKITWLLDACGSASTAHIRISDLAHEMWFMWHSSLWKYQCASNKADLGMSVDESFLLLQPIRTTTVTRMLQSSHPLVDYDAYCLRLRVTSGIFWKDPPSEKKLPAILLSMARSLFQQLIYVHRKSFEDKKFEKIEAAFNVLKDNSLTEEMLLSLLSLMKTSNHKKFTSSIESLKTLLKELFSDYSSIDNLQSIGLGWLYLGALRFNLLFDPCGLDPTFKYSYKLSHVHKKISLFELEKKVRQESEQLSGNSLMGNCLDHVVNSIQHFKREEKRLKEKIVFRENPQEYEGLKSCCAEFHCYVLQCIELANHFQLQYRSAHLESSLAEACNWQVTATGFIEQLTERCTSFADITQPLRVAIYEMKLGLLLLSSSALENAVLTKAGAEDTLQILRTIYSLMSFPSTVSFGPSIMEANNIKLKPTCAINETSILNMNLLKKLIVISSENTPDQMISNLQLEASLHQNVLHLLACNLTYSHVMDISAYTLLNEIFCYFTKLWMDWKNRLKEKENSEAQDAKFKFRSREIMIEEFLGGDLCEFDSNLGASPNLEKELMELKLSQEGGPHGRTETDYLESDDWNKAQESITEDIVFIHSQLFEPSNLCGAFQVTDEKKLQNFLDSYSLGARLIEGLPSISMSLLDDDLVPEHLLCVCLEHRQISKPCHVSNIYKNPNAPEVSKMVGPLVAIRDRGRYLSEEWPGHPVLQTVLDSTEKLLKLPLTTSLSEALFRLEHLYVRACSLKESFPQFNFKDELLQVHALFTSWQKIELNSWSFVLAKVLERHEANTTKFWFPLHLVLHRSTTGDTDFDNASTIESIEDFIQTSSVGEFRKRLQLLLSFHGEIDANININSCLSPILKNTMDILYNVCGYYIQFLPLILKHIESSRKSAEQKLEEIKKLVKWEENQISGSRGARHSFGKLVKNFNDVLQQPAIVFLNIEKSVQETKFSVWLEHTKGEAKKEIVEIPMNVYLWTDTRRSFWYGEWETKPNSALQENEINHFMTNNDMTSSIRKSLSPWLEHEGVQMGWREGWISLENICQGASKFVYIWKNMSKNFVKGRALPDFLKTLEQCGLSRHKSLTCEYNVEHSEESRSYRQPSFCVEHLLGPESSSNIHLIASTCQLETEYYNSEWHEANQYYFKNLAIKQLLQHIGLNFHKDFTPQQVKQAISFVDHLILIQQDQRSFTYGFYEQLMTLKRNLSSLEDFGSGMCSLTLMQNTILSYLWKQKKLFDNLLSLTKDISLYARCVRESHLNNCFADVANFDSFESLIEKFVTRFIQAKEFLDKYLLGTNRIIPASLACNIECIITDNIEHSLIKNFEIVSDFGREIDRLSVHEASNRSVKNKLLDRLKKQASNGMEMWKEFQYKMDISCQSGESCVESPFILSACDTNDFSEAFKKVTYLVLGALEKIGLICKSRHVPGVSLPEEITSWRAVFETYDDCLQLNLINNAVVKMIIALRNVLSKSGKKNSEVWSYLGESLKHAYMFLNLLFCLANGIMSELLAVHKTVTETSFMLSHVFISLFSNGFGNVEEHSDETDCDKYQGAAGTGMGEGEGVKDVSDQITEESQILGSSEKQMEDIDNTDMVPDKKQKGIEMDEDFAAETFSVSEGSSGSDDDDREDDDNLNVESLMGQNAENSDAVRERHWDKDEDGSAGDSKEKYEQGAAVKETDPASKELRAKCDIEAAMDNSTAVGDDFDNKEGVDEDISCPDDVEASDEILDKGDAFEDPSGLQVEEKTEKLDELDIDNDPEENAEALSEAEADADEAGDDQGHPFDKDSNPNRPDMEEDIKTEETLGPVADFMNEDDTGEGEDNTDRNEGVKKNFEDFGRDATKSSHERAMEYPLFDASTEPVNNTLADQSVMPLAFNCPSNGESCVGPFSGIPSTEIPKTDLSSLESKIDSLFGSGQTDDELKKLSHERTMPNPYRSIGDAMKDWKERVHIAPVIQELETVAPDNLNDETADEYQYISEMELGSSQALGPATSDQLVQNIVQDKNDLSKDGEDHIRQNEDVDMVDIVTEVSETERVRSSYTHMMQEPDQPSSVCEDSTTEEIARDETKNQIEDRISFQRDFTLEKLGHLNKSNALKHDVVQVTDIEILPEDRKNKAIADWKRCEFVTTRLSQELAEQLRLVMEPTLANKLQGDYKTGKRINMKKVIPYIASHFRKDKIWLRRTRPNKRDYQVIVAVDDSRSMSESHCGKVAIEALVTVCRAMSQLEVGQLAVASFGEKGNIRLLHDFGQQFTSESGVKMVSSFSFEQDNTIADEPMVDLLKYLNIVLDSSAAKARLPSGNNPLQQLILIIADGRFHEKENLKRYVRNVLNRNRMVAFLLVDSPQESITNLMEASFQDGEIRLSEYLNSFPFPYYVVLNNIEALPRTLADLLRQWFELMQTINE